MDIFRFINPVSPTRMEQGEIINDLKSKMWIERYRDAGEFRFSGPASSGLRERLPIGSFISHTDTEEIMVVENHEIIDVKGEQPEIVISGRGFETVLSGRVVGSNKNFPNFPIVDHVLAADYTWNQAKLLVEQHIYLANLIDPYDYLPFVEIINTVSGSSISADRSVQRGDLYQRFLEILEVDNLGVRVIRPGPWSPLGAASPNVGLQIHVGTDRTDQVIFSYDTGEIESSDYLWSNKYDKNSALVSGRWVEVRVTSLNNVEYNRRMMYVDASDIDDMFSEPPTGTDLNAVIVKMEQRGIEALSTQRSLALTKTEVSQDHVTATYRTDFNVGDLITVSGAYAEVTSTRRVSEFVEIEDETGRKAYPTLTMD